jgi:RNA polymerase sigma-70 factor, ECF subfamily
MDSRLPSRSAQGLHWVNHGTDTKQEIAVNYHKFDANPQADSGMAQTGVAPPAVPTSGTMPACRRAGEDARHTRFDALLATHLPALSRVAYRFCSHRETAEDLVQETLLRAWKYLDQLRDDKAAKSWLFMILRRERARGFQRKTADTVPFDFERLSDGKLDLGTDTMALYEAIDTLPVKYRAPLVLFAFGGYDVREVASDLQLKSATVKTRLFRAREKLRERLQGDLAPSAPV